MRAKTLLFGSETLEKVVLYSLVHPEARPHFRALQRHLGVSSRSLQMALEELQGRGLLLRIAEGNRALYRADAESPGWSALRAMVRAFGDPVDVLREALSTVPGVEGAFVFGSFARGEAREESDVDVLLVGDDIPRRELSRSTLESSALLGREVKVVRYGRDELARRISAGHHFTERVLRGPKRWIVGEERALWGSEP